MLQKYNLYLASGLRKHQIIFIFLDLTDLATKNKYEVVKALGI